MAEVARRLGKPLMPHQRHIVDVAFEIDPDTGLLPYNEVVVIGPRQVTGKTELILPVMTHRCIGVDRGLTDWVRRELGIVLPPPDQQRVLYTAQDAEQARLKWRDVHLQRLLKSRFADEFRYRLERTHEQILWRNGSSWVPAAPTASGSGTGDTIDLAVIDEAWARPDNRTELGFRPAMMTRLWSQLWIMSMIPGLSRKKPGEWPYLKSKRDLGRLRAAAGSNRGMAFFDFTAAAGADPGDPATWYSCMPGLGRTVREPTVRADWDAMSVSNLVDFCAEYLSWEPEETVAKWTLVKEETWADRIDVDSGIVGRPALGVEINERRDRGWIGAAGYRPDGDYHVEVVEPGYKVPASMLGIDWMERRIADMHSVDKPVTVVIDPRRPASSLIAPLRARGIDVYTPNQQEIAAGCGRFFDATGETRMLLHEPSGESEPAAEQYEGPLLWHIGQPVLDRAMGQAKPYDMGNGSFVFVRRGTASEIGPLYCVTLGLLGLVAKGEEIFPEPDIFI